MIRIQTDPPSSQVVFSIHQWAHLIDDLRPVWAGIREVYNRHQRRHFATEGASTGTPWPGQSAPTVPIVPGHGPYDEYKRRRAPGQPVLVFTGKLRRAATGGAGSLRRETAKSMELGVDQSAVPYAAGHHRGEAVESVLFGRKVQLKKRPIIRFTGSILGDKSIFDRREDKTTFGYAVRQLVQAHVVRARRESFDLDTTAADATIARILRTDTR